MCATTRPRRKPAVSAEDRTTVNVLAALTAILSMEIENQPLRSLAPLRAVGLGLVADCLTRGDLLRKLARLADEDDVQWHRDHGRHTVEDLTGAHVPLDRVFPHLKEERS